MKNISKKGLFYRILILLIVIGGIGVVSYALYNGDSIDDEYLQKASKFYFSSDLLDESEPIFQYSAYSDISVNLYNYDLNNQSLISDITITYDTLIKYYNISNDQIGANVTTTGNNTWTIVSGNKKKATFNIPFIPNAAYVIVEVSSTSPYTKTINARFNFNSDIINNNYDFIDNGNYCTLTINTGTISSNVTISWDKEKYAPDDTNSLISGYTTNVDTQSKTISLNANCTYTLIFFENTLVNHSTLTNQSFSTTLILPQN